MLGLVISSLPIREYSMITEQFLKKRSYKTDHLSELPIRSIAKSISWRILGTLDTIVISWLVTHKVSTAFSIGAIEFFTKMILYFFHERLWNIVKWGKK